MFGEEYNIEKSEMGRISSFILRLLGRISSGKEEKGHWEEYHD